MFFLMQDQFYNDPAFVYNRYQPGFTTDYL